MLLKSFPTRKLEQRTSRDHLLKVATAIEAKVRPVGTESAPLIKGESIEEEKKKKLVNAVLRILFYQGKLFHARLHDLSGVTKSWVSRTKSLF